MEKIISQEERIRRAEEIYYRRKLNNNNVRMPSSQVKQGRENRQFSLYKKMILQILICIFIYLIFSLIKETNYIFSENVLNKTKEFLSVDLNFTQISAQIGDFFQNNKDKFSFLTKWSDEENSENKEENTQNIEQEGDNAKEQTNSNQQENNLENANIEGEQASITQEATGIGGSKENTQTVQVAAKTTIEKTQMQIDAEYIKKNFSLTLPAKAKITSPYGKREPTEIISENHPHTSHSKPHL